MAEANPKYVLPPEMKKYIDDNLGNYKPRSIAELNTQNPDIVKFRKEQGITGNVAPKFTGNDIEFQVEIEKLIENNPVAKVALREMMQRSGGDLSTIMRNLQRNNSEYYGTNTRGYFSQPYNNEKIISGEDDYTVRYNATDVFDSKTKKGKTYVSLLEELRDKGEEYPKIIDIYKLNDEGKKEFNREYYNTLTPLQKTIIQVQAENKSDTLNTIVHELMHYGFQTLEDKNYISKAEAKNLEKNQNFGFDLGYTDDDGIPFYSKEHILIQDILTNEGKIPLLTDLQLLSRADTQDLYDYDSKQKTAEALARREVNEALNSNSLDNPNIDVTTRDPNRGPFTSLYFRNYYNKNQSEYDVAVFGPGDEDDMNEIERTAYDKLVNKYLSYSEEEIAPIIKKIELQKPGWSIGNLGSNTRQYSRNTIKRNPDYSIEDNPNLPEYKTKKYIRKSGPYNIDFENASYGMENSLTNYKANKKDLQDDTSNIRVHSGGTDSLTASKNLATKAANQWLADNDNTDVTPTIKPAQNLNSQTNQAFRKNDVNPRTGYESGQDAFNVNKPETYTGPVPALMAEGGQVMAIDEQTEMAFKDRPPRRDPVSGNEVPPGAMPSEVRDDIPAQLSEGEYVVPADVLQYYGIKFFEDLRNTAKMELSGLEEGGRIGGEPVEGQDDLPFSADELETYEDGEEAPVQAFDEGGPVTEMETPYFMGGNKSSVRTYVNDAGLKMYIRFVNGIAIPPIPTGYYEEGATTTTSPVSPVNVSSNEDNDDATNDVNNFIGYDNLNADQIAQFTGQVYGSIANFLGILPGVSLALTKQKEKFNAAAERISKDATVSQTIRDAYANALAISKLPANQQKDAAKKFAATTGKRKVAPWLGPWSYKAQLDTERKSKGVNNLQGLMKEEDIEPTIKAALDSKTGDEGLPFGDDDTYVLDDDPNYQILLDRQEEAEKEAAKQREAEDSSNAGDFTGGQTNKGSNTTAGGFGGTGRGRSGYNKGGLATRKKKKK